MFKQTSDNSRVHGSTAALTALATSIARDILKTVNDNTEQYEEAVRESMKSHDAMDELITTLVDLSIVDFEFLKQEDEDVLLKMIKSQQSKRSRAISKDMTIENYLILLTGGVAENILRLAANKPKQHSGFAGSRRTSVDYTDEEKQLFAEDIEALRRAIKNVQSKKTNERKKENFTEDSERYQEILRVEAELKAIRDGHNAEAAQALEKNQQVTEILKDVDPSALKAAEAKEILNQIQQTLAEQ